MFDSFKLKFGVTAQHIACGRRRNCAECPAAVALMEAVQVAFPSAQVRDPWVWFKKSGFRLDGVAYEGRTPTQVEWFFSDFDANRSVEPLPSVEIEFYRPFFTLNPGKVQP